MAKEKDMNRSLDYIKLLVIAFCFYVSACTVYDPSNIDGTYEESSFYGTHHELILDKNKFTFYLHEGLLADTLHGTWSKKGNRLLLKQQVTHSYAIREKKGEKNNIQIHLKDIKTNNETSAIFYIYQDGKLITTSYDSTLKMQIYNVDSIIVGGLKHKSYSILPIKNDQNCFQVYLAEKEFDVSDFKFKLGKNYVKFENLKLKKISRDTLNL